MQEIIRLDCLYFNPKEDSRGNMKFGNLCGLLYCPLRKFNIIKEDSFESYLIKINECNGTISLGWTDYILYMNRYGERDVNNKLG
jgi:hypothetical protein